MLAAMTIAALLWPLLAWGTRRSAAGGREGLAHSAGLKAGGKPCIAGLVELRRRIWPHDQTYRHCEAKTHLSALVDEAANGGARSSSPATASRWPGWCNATRLRDQGISGSASAGAAGNPRHRPRSRDNAFRSKRSSLRSTRADRDRDATLRLQQHGCCMKPKLFRRGSRGCAVARADHRASTLARRSRQCPARAVRTGRLEQIRHRFPGRAIDVAGRDDNRNP